MDGTARFDSAYDTALDRWPVPVHATDVDTEFGSTHVLASGPGDAPPLVLLPGGGATATAWAGVAGELSATRRVIAVDTMGDVGRSRNDGRPLKSRADLMAWLDDLLAGLGIDAADLAGHSYGGWIALAYTLHAPQRVRRLTLLDPTSCFAGMRASYLLHSVPLLRATEARMRRFLHWETGGIDLDPVWVDVVATGAEHVRTSIVLPKRPTPEAVRSVTTPTLVLLAEHSRTHDVTVVGARARDQLRQARVEVLAAESHHSIPGHGADRIGAAMAAFLT